MKDDDDVTRIMKLFAGATSAHGTHGEPEQNNLKWIIKGTAKTLREPVTPKLWRDHLAGKRPLGIIPIAEDSSCSWGCIDIDDYLTDPVEVIKRVVAADLPLMPCRSKSGGVHLFLFCDPPAPAAIFQTALKACAAKLGVAESEIFPKQTKVDTARGDMGNWMIMPYYGDTYGGKLQDQHGMKPNGFTMTLAEFLKAAEGLRVNHARLKELTTLKEAPKKKNGKAKAAGLGGDPNVPFSDGPVCLEILAGQGIPAGTQNEALFNMAVYYRRAFPDTWQDKLRYANDTYLKPPGSDDGLQGVINSVSKKEYQYGCTKRPMCDHCNATVCRLRKFGVGDDADHMLIGGLTKLAGDPPLWFIGVGDDRIQLSTEDLMDFRLFAKACANHATFTPTPMSQTAWASIVKTQMEKCHIIKLPEEVTRGGQFSEVLEDFLTNRQRGRQKEDVLGGKPWESEEDGCHYFRMKDFARFLNRESTMKNLSRTEITKMVRDLGGGDKVLRISADQTTRVWFVPAAIFTGTPPIPTPPIEGHPI